MAKVFNDERTFGTPFVKPVETLIYRLAGVNPTYEMRWTEYTLVLILFNAAIFIFLFALQLVQGRCHSIHRNCRG